MTVPTTPRHSPTIPGAPSLAVRLCTLCVLLLAACADPPGPQSRLRFCEDFNDRMQAVGEDTVFSTGFLSLVVEADRPLDADQFAIRIFRVTDHGNDPYGDEAHVAITRFESVFRLQGILSFADTGCYDVRVATPDSRFITHGRLRIVPGRGGTP